jgi:hypothetical protein
MPRWQRAYVIAMCSIIAAAFAYTACDWGQWPRLTYQPLTGSIMMKGSPAIVTINYIVGFVLCRVANKPWADRALQLFGAWAITGVVLAGSYYTWNLWPW